MEKYIFFTTILLCIFLFMKNMLIAFKTVKYIKNRHPEYLNKIDLNNVTTSGLSPSIFQFSNIDPLIKEYEKQWRKTLIYTIIAGLLAIFLFVFSK
jgi:hypothetical protein